MVVKSARYAGGFALAYAVLASAYIVLSSHLAADASHSVEELARIETTKGVLYVLLTGVMIFVGAFWAMRRIERDGQELLRREQALVVNEGRIFAGLTAASIAHDANNVLTIALADVEKLAVLVGSNDQLQRLQGAVERLIALNKRLLDSAQDIVSRERPRVDLVEATREAVAMMRVHDHVRGCHIDFVGMNDVQVVASPALVHQMVGNLVLNAGEATASRGRLQVRVDQRGDMAVVEVHDDGPGVAESRREDLFTSLGSTKQQGRGLGLFSVKACATGLGGTVEVGDSPLGGALFSVLLPVPADN